jgi:hypothetical protein
MKSAGRVSVAELLKVMELRLQMQREGIINPVESVRAGTAALVKLLLAMDPSEKVDIRSSEGEVFVARYVRATSGELLAELLTETKGNDA